LFKKRKEAKHHEIKERKRSEGMIKSSTSILSTEGRSPRAVSNAAEMGLT
jgi:hypothetical protein